MKTKYFKIFFTSLIAIIIAVSSCVKDLDVTPIDPLLITSATVYKDANAYRQVLAKCYAGLAVTGQQGPHGDGDLNVPDEGFASYSRQYWYHQELTTDEAVIGWNDQTLWDFHFQKNDQNCVFVKMMYNRLYYQISLCNEFIREAQPSKVSGRGITGTAADSVATYLAEARFLRALTYWHALDLFGNVPFVDETNAVGSFFPQRITRDKLYEYVEKELLAIEPLMKNAKANEYGRADKAAVWMLLGKLYLNAKVYIGTDKNTECITYMNKVIAAPFTLETNYSYLFLADNNLCNEIIFPITFDGVHTKTWGGTTFIINAAIGGNMVPADFGMAGGWGGTRTTPQLVDKFSPGDGRAMFHTSGQSKSISDLTAFSDGYGITKWKNKTRAGVNGSDATHPDTDFPVFRLADAYLMYAEAVLRGGTGGDATTALGYINDIRERAYGGAAGDILSGDLTLDFIIDERARELYGECHRRTDLIRFEKYSTSSYLWEWKGGVKAGASTDSHFNLFPIPAADMGVNPNLIQNPGYLN